MYVKRLYGDAENPIAVLPSTGLHRMLQKVCSRRKYLICLSTNSWSRNDKKSGETLAFRFVFVVIRNFAIFLKSDVKDVEFLTDF